MTATTDTTKRFKKGDNVTVFSNWDGKGTFRYQHAVVYSCGKKTMILTCATAGEELGNTFYVQQKYYGYGVCRYDITPRMSESDAIAHAIKLASDFLVEEREQLQSRITWAQNNSSFASDAYIRGIAKSIADLHEAAAVEYTTPVW